MVREWRDRVQIPEVDVTLGEVARGSVFVGGGRYASLALKRPRNWPGSVLRLVPGNHGLGWHRSVLFRSPPAPPQPEGALSKPVWAEAWRRDHVNAQVGFDVKGRGVLDCVLSVSAV